jgi:hypothetical protein
MWKFGAPIQSFVEKYLERLTVIALGLLIVGVVAFKFMS